MEQSCTSDLPGQVVSAVSQEATLAEQTPLARDTYRIRLHCPEIARQITPGQFFMIRPADLTDPLLGRPFALFDVYEDDRRRPAGIDFGYVRIGKLTSLMTTWEPGQRVELWGPLGNGFPLPTGGHLMMVAGGIGQTPFLATAREALGLQSYGDPARKLADQPDKI
ncbi:MAG: dihydroorotate dehydrogenase electron transfer subunit, partial [Planctomycetaceae bacterium]|nr:dihydroorotate dehydrogenase electron transfer subunit [Planctomycetaceae bacterium]